MDVREIRDMADEEILDEIEDLKEALFRSAAPASLWSVGR